MKFTNENNIPLPLAVWLLNDEYDYINDKDYISVTGLMRPLRQIILGKMEGAKNDTMDINSLLAAKVGTALHDSIEKAWNRPLDRPLMALGYQHMIGKILINPTPEEAAANPDKALVYMEQRRIREFMGFKIGGKFDLVMDGVVNDYKSTSVYSYIYGSRDEEHALQGSLYRWLNPDIIFGDYIIINYIFTDWQASMAKRDPSYPQSRSISKSIPLLSLEQTEQYIKNKLTSIIRETGLPQSKVSKCNREELWMGDDKFKYYADPAKTSGRSTKNFTSLLEANTHLREKGKGIVITEKATPKRCDYCPVSEFCTQREEMLND